MRKRVKSTEIRVIPEAEVQFKETGPQKTLVQDLQSEDSVLRLKPTEQIWSVITVDDQDTSKILVLMDALEKTGQEIKREAG